MSDSVDPVNRDSADDTAARRWAEATRRQGEAAGFADDAEYLGDKLAQEKAKLDHR